MNFERNYAKKTLAFVMVFALSFGVCNFVDAKDHTIYSRSATKTIGNPNSEIKTEYTGYTGIGGNYSGKGGVLYNISTTPFTIVNVDMHDNTAASYGGAMYIDPGATGKLTIKDSIFSNNIAGYVEGQSDLATGGLGGVVYIERGRTTISNNVFNNNKAYNGGSIFIPSALNTTIQDSIFTNNLASTTGGAISAQGTASKVVKLVIENSVFGELNSNGTTTNGNRAETFGGAIWTLQTTDINNSRFYGNSAAQNGGAIAAASGAVININNSTFDGNYTENSGSGGAIVLQSTSALTSTIKDSVFMNNKVLGKNGDGGAITLSKGFLNIENSTFEKNDADLGGALSVTLPAVETTKLTVVNSKILNNTSSVVGSALYNMGNATILGTEIKSNITKGNTDGGTFFLGAESSTTIAQSDDGIRTTFEDNISYGAGGAISTRAFKNAKNTNAKLEISNTDFINNQASTTGGALNNYFYNSNEKDGYVSIKDSIFESNKAQDGGAIYNHDRHDDKGGNTSDGKIYIANSKFTNNSAKGLGGAIYNEGTSTSQRGEILFDGNNVFEGNTDSTGANDIYNDGKITFLNSGSEAVKNVLNGGISGNGETVIDNNVELNSQKIAQSKLINNGTIYSNINELVVSDLENNGQINLSILNDVTLENQNLNGKIKFDSNNSSNQIVLNGDYSKVLGDIEVNNATLKYSDNVTSFAPSKLSFGKDSTLDLMNNNSDVINYLDVKKDFNAKIDLGDILSSSETNSGNVYIKELDIQNASDGKYQIADGTLKSNLIVNPILKNKGDINYIIYDETTGKIDISSQNVLGGFLQKAIDDSATVKNQLYDTDVLEKDTFDGGSIVKNNLVVNGEGLIVTSNKANKGGLFVGDFANGKNANFILVDTNIQDVDIASKHESALIVDANSSLTIEARDKDVKLSGTTNGASAKSSKAVVKLNSSGTTYSSATFNANGNKITIEDDILSDNKNNVVNFEGSKEILFNGYFDPTTSNVNTTVVRGGYDDDIAYNLNSGGLLRYLNDKNLYDSSLHGTSYNLNSINFNGGTLDTINGVVTDFKLDNLSTTTQNSNWLIDVDLSSKKADTLSANSVSNGGGTLNLAGFNIIKESKDVEIKIPFAAPSDGVNAINIALQGGSDVFIQTPIYRYIVNYDDTVSGSELLTFRKFGNGGYGDYNPAILAAPVAAQVGSYLTQLNNYEQAFNNMDMRMLMTKKQRIAYKYANKIASINKEDVITFDPNQQNSEQLRGLWVKPFATFESVGLKNGPKVDNISYGSLFGGDSDLIELRNGWDMTYSLYAGYNGSHQNYDGISIYQNGGVLGASAAFYKGNFFTGLTANVGANNAQANTIYGIDNFTMLTTGIASKTGYNFELGDGKFIIQPNYMMSYTFVNTFDFTNSAGVRVDSDPLHAIQIAPGVKFIGNLANGWQPYAGVQMVWNIMDKTDFMANDVSLPDLSIKPYVQYGLGLQKRWGDRFTAFGQAMIRNGGRNGVALQLGFQWALGEATKKVSYEQESNKEPQYSKTLIKFDNIK